MPQMIVRHEVQNYDEWKKKFDAHGIFRQMAGVKSQSIFRNTENPNDVSVLLEWENIEKALKFCQSQDVQEKMKEAGIVGEPLLYLRDEDLQ